MNKSLLPPNSTALERALEGATERIGAAAVPVSDLWNPDTCPAAALPWLAWALSVDVWDSAWSEDIKRRVIAESIAIHRRKGTVWAVREALRAAGYAEATVSEGLPRLTYDGAQLHDGVETYFGGSRWALFDVHADLGETEGLSASDRDRLVRLIDMAKPVSRHLREVSFGAHMADQVDTAESTTTTVSPALVEEAHFGLTYGGQIAHDQAQLIEGFDPVRFDGAWRHDAEQGYSGQNKYSRWEVTGERYANERSGFAMDTVPVSANDAYELAAPLHDGRSAADGAAFYGAASSRSRDVMAITLTRQVRHNGRHIFDGSRRHAATHVESLTA
ncbi:phage tail protein I [Geoalkalibacter halelectricus]|uniref:phage tail protein I n=1 Tax=Geoalkalibacter halelectricus TaxID=2847045 RepID=UPI003D23B541